jgi:hypothetical protein
MYGLKMSLKIANAHLSKNIAALKKVAVILIQNLIAKREN